MVKELKMRQDHNHAILKEVTKLEREALENIENIELFENLIYKIENLQKKYIKG